MRRVGGIRDKPRACGACPLCAPLLPLHVERRSSNPGSIPLAEGRSRRDRDYQRAYEVVDDMGRVIVEEVIYGD